MIISVIDSVALLSQNRDITQTTALYAKTTAKRTVKKSGVSPRVQKIKEMTCLIIGKLSKKAKRKPIIKVRTKRQMSFFLPEHH